MSDQESKMVRFLNNFSVMDELIPGLPFDVALDCLFRVPYVVLFRLVRRVCRGWKTLIDSPEFFSLRRSEGHCRDLFVVLTQLRYMQYQYPNSWIRNPVVSIRLSDRWCDITLPPSCLSGKSLSFFCGVAAAGLEIVVIECQHLPSSMYTNCVYVYSFVTHTWRLGTPMPGEHRLDFGCTSDGERMVFVAGGIGKDRVPLKSAMAYDVPNNKWCLMPDMKRDRVCCKASFEGGKLIVIGGELQPWPVHEYNHSVEAFDPETWIWDPIREMVLEVDMIPSTCTTGEGDNRMYAVRQNSREIAALLGSIWTRVAGLPDDFVEPTYMMRCLNTLLVFGKEECRIIGRLYDPQSMVTLTLDLERNTWATTPMPGECDTIYGCVLKL